MNIVQHLLYNRSRVPLVPSAFVAVCQVHKITLSYKTAIPFQVTFRSSIPVNSALHHNTFTVEEEPLVQVTFHFFIRANRHDRANLIQPVVSYAPGQLLTIKVQQRLRTCKGD